MDSPRTPKSSSKDLGPESLIYAVQCEECFKWRLIKSQEQYEEIRSKIIEEPFHCNWKPNTNCQDPEDIEYDQTRTWVSDKPNAPKTPEGFRRNVVPRKDLSKLDIYYISPTGKRLRSISEVVSFLETNKKFKGLSLSEFSFASPKVMDDTFPENVSRSTRIKTE